MSSKRLLQKRATVEKSRPSKWLVLSAVVLGSFVGAMNTSIVNVTIPQLMQVFKAPIHQVEWIITAYMIALATAMPIVGWLKERWSYRGLFVGGLGVFTLGSVLCGAAQTIEFLIVARIIQAFGAGVSAPGAMAIVTSVFPPKERGRAFGLWGLGVVIGPAIGPTLGGFLSEAYSWRWIFWINLPLGLLAMWWAWSVLEPEDKKNAARVPFDLRGFLYITAAIVGSLYALTLAKEAQHTVEACALLILSMTSLWLFVREEKRAKAPLWDLSIFRNKEFMACILVTAARSAALFGGVFLVPFLLQQQLGYSEMESGLMMLPGSLILAVMMPASGWLSDRRGVRLMSLLGLLVVAASMFLFADVGTKSSFAWLTAILLIRGVGLGFLVTPISAATMNAVPPHQVATASSISNIAQQAGGTFGIASLVLLKEFAAGMAKQRGMSGAAGSEMFSLHAAFVAAGVVMLLALIPAWRIGKEKAA